MGKFIIKNAQNLKSAKAAAPNLLVPEQKINVKVVGKYDMTKYAQKSESLRLPEVKAAKVLKSYTIPTSDEDEHKAMSTSFAFYLAQKGIKF